MSSLFRAVVWVFVRVAFVGLCWLSLVVVCSFFLPMLVVVCCCFWSVLWCWSICLLSICKGIIYEYCHVLVRCVVGHHYLVYCQW